MIIVFTGNGKGKTTAALGQAMRVLGHGKNALVVQFLKGPWRSGEDEFAKKFCIPPEKFRIKKMGLGFVGILGDTLPREEHAKAALKALAYFKSELKNGKWHLIVLDEINVAVSLGLLKPAEVIKAIKNFPEDKILVLTGRHAPEKFVKLADLVTEMREIKHPYGRGKKGRVAAEF
jgi:cob(I)alamin adenosyltransferase